MWFVECTELNENVQRCKIFLFLNSLDILHCDIGPLCNIGEGEKMGSFAFQADFMLHLLRFHKDVDVTNALFCLVTAFREYNAWEDAVRCTTLCSIDE